MQFCTEPLYLLYTIWFLTRQKFDSLETGEPMFTINRKYEADKDRISIIELTMSAVYFLSRMYGGKELIHRRRINTQHISLQYQKNLHAYVIIV